MKELLKVTKKDIFFEGKDSKFNPRIIRIRGFLIGRVQIKKYGSKTLFLLFNIWIKLKCFKPPSPYPLPPPL